jgi:hypothetical protein
MRELVERPAADARKINHKDNFELCYLRHKYFRKINYNPTPEEMRPYTRIVEYVSRNTFYTYKNLFITVGMDLEDIVSTSRVQLVNYLGLFEISKEKTPEKYETFCIAHKKEYKKDPDDYQLLGKNRANFTMFMKQRMEDLVRICNQKAKNIKGFRVEEYAAFYGPKPPPEDLHKVIEDHKQCGFKTLSTVAFKAIKKRMKANINEPFQFAGMWYVAITLESRNLTILDFEGAGLSPYDNFHNMDPEKILSTMQEEIKFDKKRKVFDNYSKENKAKVIYEFIEKNRDNPQFEEELDIARGMLENMGIVHGNR